MNTEHEFCFTIKLKQNNSRDLKNVLHAQETFCRYFRHTKRTDKKTTATKKNLPKQKTKNTQQQKQNTKRPKSKIKRNNKILKTKKNKGNKETYK